MLETATTTTQPGLNAAPRNGTAAGRASLLSRSLAWWVLFIALGVTAFGWHQSREAWQESRLTRFQAERGAMHEAVASRMVAYTQVLRGAQAAIGAAGHPDREQWSRLHQALRIQDSYPGIVGIVYIRSIAADQLAAALSDIRRFEPAYAFRPPGEREHYALVTSVEPRTPGNLPVIGADSWAHPERRRTLASARDSGESRITAKLSLVIDDPKKPQPGFLMYQPVYRGGVFPATVEARREALLGFATIGFRLDPLMRGILGEVSSKVAMRVFDGTVLSDEHLMYASHPGVDLTGDRLRQQNRFLIGGREWTVEYVALAGFDDNHAFLGWLIALSGTAVAFMMFGIVTVLQGSNRRAQALAERMTASSTANETKLRELIAQSPLGIWMMDRDGVIVDCNEKFAQYAGASRERIIGFNMLRDARDQSLTAAILAALKGESVKIETAYTSTTGGVTSFYQYHFHPVRLDGAFGFLLAFAEDISQRKAVEVALQASEAALRVSQEQFFLLFEWAPVALSFSKQEDGFSTTTWNRAWLASFGYPPEVVRDRGGDQFGLWVDPVERARYLDEAQAHEEVVVREVEMRRADGAVRRVAVSGRLIRGGPVSVLLTCYDDVTELRQQQIAIQELNAQLENRVAARTRDLSLSNEQLSTALDNLKRAQGELIRAEKLAGLGALVAGVAHELNTPIGNCLTVATALDDRTRELAAHVDAGQIRRSELTAFFASAQAGTQVLARSMERAHELLSHFKQVAVDQTSEKRRNFDLKLLIEEILAMLHPALKRTPYQVEVQVPDGIAMDSYPGPLGQIISNLVNNALLHAFEGREQGLIRIAARVDEGWVAIEIIDNGNGMADEVREHAFEPFFTTKFGQGGSGLGLNIVFNLATAVLGGQVSLASTHGQGCQFTIHLPQRAPSRNPSA